MELENAVKYVAAAYLVVWVAILVYLLLIGQKVTRLEQQLDDLEGRLAAAPHAVAESTREPVA